MPEGSRYETSDLLACHGTSPGSPGGRFDRGCRLHRRWHEPARPDEDRRRTSDLADRHQSSRPCRHRDDRARADCASARWSGTAILPPTDAFAGTIRRCRARCFRAPARSCATRRRRQAISCSARAAITSTTRPSPATKESPEAAVRRLAASTACTPYWEPATTASPCILPTWPSPCASTMQASRRYRRTAASARSRSPSFIACPATRPQIETILQPGELITAVVLPPPLGGSQHYRKVRDRASYAFALVSVAAVVVHAQGRISDARLAFGGLAAKPWRDETAEKQLIGSDGGPVARRAFADAVLEGARGFGHNDFKIPLLRRTIEATLATAIENFGSAADEIRSAGRQEPARQRACRRQAARPHRRTAEGLGAGALQFRVPQGGAKSRLWMDRAFGHSQGPHPVDRHCRGESLGRRLARLYARNRAQQDGQRQQPGLAADRPGHRASRSARCLCRCRDAGAGARRRGAGEGGLRGRGRPLRSQGAACR